MRVALIIGMIAGSIAVYGTAQAARPAGGFANPVRAVVVFLRPFTSAKYNSSACNPVEGKYAPCPLTVRLRRQLRRELRYERARHRDAGANPICRCQNPPPRIQYERLVRHGSAAAVDVRWIYGAGTTFTLTFVLRRLSSVWLIDDVYCAGHPNTSIFHLPVRPCP